MPTAMRVCCLVVLVGLLGACSPEFSRVTRDTGYTGDPRRVVVVDALDRRAASNVSRGFGPAVQARLDRCGIAAQVFVVDPLEFDNRARGIALLTSFNPDAVIRVTLPFQVIGGYVNRRDYEATVTDVRLRRRIWHGTLRVFDPGFFENVSRRGVDLANVLVTTLTNDRILSACQGASVAATAGQATPATPAAPSAP